MTAKMPTGMTRRARVRVATTVLIMTIVALLSGCSEANVERFEYLRVTVDGQQALGISKKDAAIRGVVVYFHGLDADEFAVTSDDPHKTLTEKLVNAGFAVVSSRAGGNAFGNTESQRNYRELANMALELFRVQNVFFLAESMGAVAAINLLAASETSRIRGLAAINPAIDLANASASYAPIVAESYPDHPARELANPMNFPPNALAGRQIRFYVSPDDVVVPAAANAMAFEKRFRGDAKISVVKCSGGQGDPSCFQGDDLLKWFSSLELRVEP
jgi:pimeloyl-ACP methyl ester carboxylesterase